MRLNKDFFRICSCQHSDRELRYDITLNADHQIYKAHFPGLPITPGVCIIQLVKELLEDSQKCELMIRQVKNVKFLNVISPESSTNLSCTFTKIVDEQDEIRAQAVVQNTESVFAKISLICTRS